MAKGRTNARSVTQRGQTCPDADPAFPCPPPPALLLLEVRHQQKSVPASQGSPHQHLPTFICEATAILMKLDCVRPRHRKLSPDGRWTDMEFESAENGKAGIYRKKRGGRGRRGEGGGVSEKCPTRLVPVQFSTCYTQRQFEETGQRVEVRKQNRVKGLVHKLI